jgi:adenylate cyclase
MERDRLSRKLAVILHADVVGSTLLVQKNETLAHERIQAAFNSFSETIAAYGGKAHEIRGDALVAEFNRASDAVPAAIAFQALNEESNSVLNDDIKPQLRIGISLGEVIIADNTVTGAGVVLAQRLEQLAETGGVVVQGSVSETVPIRMPFEFENLGEKTLKGFDQPVRTFAVKLRHGEALPEPEENRTLPSADSKTPRVPDRPSIAVLPFTNISGDPRQEYFSDGITEDVITSLSRFRDLFVIASNTTFAFKGKAVKIQDVSCELGVRYVLEGSVQRSADHVRITTQLIDGHTGGHLWSERYDRQLEDIFVLQDEVTETIVATLASGWGGRLRKAWQGRAEKKKTENFEAFDCFMCGMELFNFRRDDTRRAGELFEEAIRLDPGYAKPYAKLAWVHIIDAAYGWSEDYEGSMAKGLEFASSAVEQDDDESWAHWALAGYYMYMRQHDLAFAEFEKALELNQNDAEVLTDLGMCLSYAGRAEEGLESAIKAMRVNRHYPEWFLMQLGQIYHDARQYEKAVVTFKSLRNRETTLTNLYLAASYAALNQSGKAKEIITRLLEFDPLATLEKWVNVKLSPYSDAKDLDHLRENLRQAGLPE